MFFTQKRLRLYFFALLYLQLLISLSCWKFIKAGTIDFRLFYASGHIVRAGDSPQLYDYQTQLHSQNEFVTPRSFALTLMEPPFAALVFLPLSFFRYIPAYFLFTAVNLFLLGIAIAAMRPHLPELSARMPWAPALLFITFFPVGITFAQGQVSLVLLAIYCISFAELQYARTFLAGAVFSLALLKFQIALPIVLLFLLWRQWKFVAGFSAGAAVLGSLSAWSIGITHLGVFWHSLFSTPAAMAAAAAQEKYAVYPQRMPNLYGLFYVISDGRRWGLILTIAGSVLLLLWAARKPASLPLATLVALLVSYHLYIHDLTLLLLPISLLANQQLVSNRTTPERRNWRRLAGISAMAFLLITPVTLFLISSNWLPLLAVPILVLTLTLGAALANPSPTADMVRSPQVSCEAPALI